MGDAFALKDPATNLVDLPFGMNQVDIEIRQSGDWNAPLTAQALPGHARPRLWNAKSANCAKPTKS
jgi:hypothetical protein